MRVTVLGAGSWGTTVAALLCRRDHEVLLWARNPEVAAEVNLALESGADFVASSQVEAAAQAAGVDAATTAAIVEDYKQAQLRALKAGLLAAALIALVWELTSSNIASSI